MTGIHKLIVRNKYIEYTLCLQRGVTVIKGDSATGKSELVRLLQLYNDLGKTSGVFVECDVPVHAQWGTEQDVFKTVPSLHNEILIFDEDKTYIKTKEFADLVKHSDCYVVLITRDPLGCIPYSIKEVKKLVSGTVDNLVHTEFDGYYGVQQLTQSYKPDVVIVEDEQSGFEMFNRVFPNKCISAKGNSKVYDKLLELYTPEKSFLLIVDGAAFGAHYDKIIKYIKGKFIKNVLIWMPESFEYLVVQSFVSKEDKDYKKLVYTTDYADTVKYVSWEDFYTELLKAKSKEIVGDSYNKNHLTEGYKNDVVVQRFKSCIPRELI